MQPIRKRFMEILQGNDKIASLTELRSLLCDLVINLQEVALLESKNSNSASSGTSNDDLGTLVELITSEFDPVTC